MTVRYLCLLPKSSDEADEKITSMTSPFCIMYIDLKREERSEERTILCLSRRSMPRFASAILPSILLSDASSLLNCDLVSDRDMFILSSSPSTPVSFFSAALKACFCSLICLFTSSSVFSLPTSPCLERPSPADEQKEAGSRPSR